MEGKQGKRRKVRRGEGEEGKSKREEEKRELWGGGGGVRKESWVRGKREEG